MLLSIGMFFFIGMLLALLGGGGGAGCLLKRMGEALIGEFLYPNGKTLFIRILDRKDGNDVLLAIRFIALSYIENKLDKKTTKKEKKKKKDGTPGTNLQTSITFKLTNSPLRKDMPTRHEINRLDIRPQRLRRNGTNPLLAMTATRSRRMSIPFCINLKFQLDHIP